MTAIQRVDVCEERRIFHTILSVLFNALELLMTLEKSAGIRVYIHTYIYKLALCNSVIRIHIVIVGNNSHDDDF